MSNEDEMDPHSFIVLEALNALNHKPIWQKVIFQKIIFLTLKNFKKLFELADFKAHLLGPYSPSIENAKNQLLKTGEVEFNDETGLQITNVGIEKLIHLQDQDEEIGKIKHFEEVIQNIKKIFIDYTTDEMLAVVYRSYPEYIESSIKADSLNYEKIFIELYKKGKLSISKIAELLEISYSDAYDLIKSNTKPIILK